MKAKLSALSALTLALLLPLSSQAAIFDAADILQQNSGAVGVFGEILLSDPTSEGAEVRGRYGLSDDLNVAAILGVGSKGKQFRFGGEAVYNFIPDWDGQLGFSALASALYLERFSSGGVQLRVGPMLHKKFEGFGLNPAIVYFGLPFYFEGRSGHYDTGAQIVLGGLFDIADQGRFYASGEAGVKLSKSDSYILAGVGVRFGELRFYKREKGSHGGSSGSREKEYRDEDFK
jgi:hypothetical protein